MSAPKPVARTKADQPDATRQLSTSEVQALEKSGEAEHQIGERREELTDEAEAEKESAAAAREKPGAGSK